MKTRELNKLGIDYSLDSDGRRRNADGLRFEYGPFDACHHCQERKWRKYGFDRHGLQRWICMNCRHTIGGNQYKTGVFYEDRPLGIGQWPAAGKTPAAVALLVSGRFSVRQVATETGLSKNTVCKILANLEEWLKDRSDLQAYMGLTVPLRCECGQPLRAHRRVCEGRRARCRPQSLAA